MAKRKKKPFDKRLKAYTAAAAGALIVVPAAAQTAVHYSGPQNIGIDLGNPLYALDMNSDGNDDFSFSFSFSYSIGINSDASGRGHIDETVNHDPANLPANYTIRPGLTAANYYWNTGWNTLAGIYATSGNFVGQRGYIGVRFNTAAGTKYGWIQFESNAASTNGTIIDWAWEDSGEPILAGDTKGQAPTAIPTLNQWGLIALIALLSAAGLKTLPKREET
ncbi:MAG: IPTL-CTERM sorting domain-containing protein [Thermodesulfobacteriota bacterium]|nr:IPTL-CTERM sorting domain-containing protein [Thermodesulfobacteriota bacterium]